MLHCNISVQVVKGNILVVLYWSMRFKLQFTVDKHRIDLSSHSLGVDILKLVAAQIGSQWIDLYKSLASATEREVAAFSNGYTADHERAYAALQHWTIRDSDANLAKLINALHRQRRIDVVDKIRSVMEDNPQVSNSRFSVDNEG